MRRRDRSKIRTAVVVVGLGMVLAAPTVAYVSGPGAAAATCYTGCEPVSTVPAVSTPDVPTPPVATAPSGGGLAFTGADIAEMAALGAGAIGAGSLLVWRGRRRATI